MQSSAAGYMAATGLVMQSLFVYRHLTWNWRWGLSQISRVSDGGSWLDMLNREHAILKFM